MHTSICTHVKHHVRTERLKETNFDEADMRYYFSRREFTNELTGVMQCKLCEGNSVNNFYIKTAERTKTSSPNWQDWSIDV